MFKSDKIIYIDSSRIALLRIHIWHLTAIISSKGACSFKWVIYSNLAKSYKFESIRCQHQRLIHNLFSFIQVFSKFRLDVYLRERHFSTFVTYFRWTIQNCLQPCRKWILFPLMLHVYVIRFTESWSLSNSIINCENKDSIHKI